MSDPATAAPSQLASLLPPDSATGAGHSLAGWHCCVALAVAVPVRRLGWAGPGQGADCVSLRC